MIPFDTYSMHCSYRVAGIALHDNHILLQQKDDVWFLPGGDVAPQESARDALKRAMRQLVESDVCIGHLLWVSEHFADQVYDSEMAFYFQVVFPPALLCFPRDVPIRWVDDMDKPVILKWVPIVALGSLHVVPSCLPDELGRCRGAFEAYESPLVWPCMPTEQHELAREMGGSRSWRFE